MANIANGLINSSHPATPNPLLELPKELTVKISRELDFRAVESCRLVCKDLNISISNNGMVWQELFERMFPHMNSENIDNREAFYASHPLTANFPKGYYTSGQIGKTDSGVSGIAIIKGHSVAPGNVKEWGKWYFKREKDIPIQLEIAKLDENTTLVATPLINTFIDENKNLLYKSGAKGLCIWDLNTATYKTIIRDENIQYTERQDNNSTNIGPGTAFLCHLDFLVTGHKSGKIQAWNLRSEQFQAIFGGTHGDEHSVSSLIVVHDQLWASFSNGECKIYDLQNFQYIKTLEMQGPFYFTDGVLYSISDSQIKIWDPNTLTCTKTFNYRDAPNGHVENITKIRFIAGRLCTASLDNTIKIWDLDTGGCLTTLPAYPGSVNCLHFYNNKLYAGSSLGQLKYLDFTSNHLDIFEEIAVEFEDYQINSPEMRFSRMPQSAKSKIYEELYNIIKVRLTNDYPGCSEDAFFGKNGQSATPQEKARAIRNYVAAERKLKDNIA